MEQVKIDIRKAVAVLMSLFLVLAFTPMAFTQQALADGEKTITVTDTVKGSTYDAYQVFSYDEAKGTFKIADNSPFYATIAADKDFNLTKIGDTNEYYVANANENKDGAALAQTLRELVKAEGFAGKPVATKTAGADKETIELEVPAGYYFVTTTTGTIASLDKATDAVNIADKNDTPTVDKEVQEDSNQQWGNSDDASIGEIVNYRTTITAKKGALNYILHDTMTEGLTFNDDVAIEGLTEGTDYTVKTDATDGCTFEVIFAKSFLDSIAADKTIVVTYSATVNENAVIAGDGNDNKTKLTYGEKNENETAEDTTKTFVWDFDVLKYANGDTNAPLAGATFTLSQGSTVLKFTKDGNKYTVNPEGNVTEFTTDDTGKIKIIGLDSDTYTLTETNAPAGYNKLEGPVSVIIASTGAKPADKTLSYTVNDQGTDHQVGVNNQAGGTLPSTGGMGTTIMYIIGGVIVVAAVVVLVARRRSSNAA